MTYNYFIPTIHLGPISGYIFNQVLPLHDIEKLIIGNNAKFEIIRKVLCNRIILYEKKSIIKFEKNKWNNHSAATFKWGPVKEKNDLCYIETQINLLNGDGLTSASLPSFYVNYISPNKKNFITFQEQVELFDKIISVGLLSLTGLMEMLTVPISLVKFESSALKLKLSVRVSEPSCV